MSHCRESTLARGFAAGASRQAATSCAPIEDRLSLLLLQWFDWGLERDVQRGHALRFDDFGDAFESDVTLVIEHLRVVVADEGKGCAMRRRCSVAALTFAHKNSLNSAPSRGLVLFTCIDCSTSACI